MIVFLITCQSQECKVQPFWLIMHAIIPRASLYVTNALMPTAWHGNSWQCLTFRQCHSTSQLPERGRAALAALLSSPISQHVRCLLNCRRKWETREPWAGSSHSQQRVTALLLLLRNISQSWTCSEPLPDQEMPIGVRSKFLSSEAPSNILPRMLSISLEKHRFFMDAVYKREWCNS